MIKTRAPAVSKNGTNQHSKGFDNVRPTEYGNSADYTARRLKRDKPGKRGQVGNDNAAADKTNGDNITVRSSTSDDRGTSKAYIASRLQREAPELYEQVVAGDLTVSQCVTVLAWPNYHASKRYRIQRHLSPVASSTDTVTGYRCRTRLIQILASLPRSDDCCDLSRVHCSQRHKRNLRLPLNRTCV